MTTLTTEPRAIGALVEATSAGTPTTLEAAEPPVALPPPVALAAYRIVQESLTNVVRHAGRVAATVGLRHHGGYVHVDVVNDGGAKPAPFSDGTGAGLAGMRQRAAALGGTRRMPGRARPAGSPSARSCQWCQPHQPAGRPPAQNDL
ncbi:MAG TPA: ATP-binding protein [Streptosporangiaceae bacterium]|nr:ATP-binding protein [Streptosporangiaceae bacterium]